MHHASWITGATFFEIAVYANLPSHASHPTIFRNTLFVRGLDSYVKDSGHMLTILDSIRFRGEHRFIFTMDNKSLYTVIPNDEELRALKYFLEKRKVLGPPTHTQTTQNS